MNKFYAGEQYADNYTFGPFDTAKEALDAVLQDHLIDKPKDHDASGFIAGVGELVLHVPHLDASDILDRLSCDASDNCGEAAEDYLSPVSVEDRLKLESILNAGLEAWLRATDNVPKFGTIENDQKFILRKDGEWMAIS